LTDLTDLTGGNYPWLLLTENFLEIEVTRQKAHLSVSALCLVSRSHLAPQTHMGYVSVAPLPISNLAVPNPFSAIATFPNCTAFGERWKFPAASFAIAKWFGLEELFELAWD
jgi:hypothetical protein